MQLKEFRTLQTELKEQRPASNKKKKKANWHQQEPKQPSIKRQITAEFQLMRCLCSTQRQTHLGKCLQQGEGREGEQTFFFSQNTQEIKKMLFNWTKQDKTCKSLMCFGSFFQNAGSQLCVIFFFFNLLSVTWLEITHTAGVQRCGTLSSMQSSNASQQAASVTELASKQNRSVATTPLNFQDW